MSKDLNLVYTGSRTEGLFIKEILEENNIHCMYKDTFQSGIQAGWADGLPEDRIKIFVGNEDIENAKKVLNEYFASRDTEK
jgi:hypothetical protein